jgi:hypothetical protein
MFSHLLVGVGDFDRALAFYNPLSSALDIAPRCCERGRRSAGCQSRLGPRPLFLVGTPDDPLAHAPGIGQMFAFLGGSGAHVVRDPDGNGLRVACRATPM